eukprot:5724715-Pleurochrysis_carterae.AAC.1
MATVFTALSPLSSQRRCRWLHSAVIAAVFTAPMLLAAQRCRRRRLHSAANLAVFTAPLSSLSIAERCHRCHPHSTAIVVALRAPSSTPPAQQL